MQASEKLTLSVTETAEALGVSRPTVYQLLHREDFPSFKVGTRTLINRQRLQSWVDAQTEGGAG